MTVKNFRNSKTVFLLKECFLLSQGIGRQYNPTCSRPKPPNSLSSNFPQALLATPLCPSPRGPAPFTSHFLVTALLCAASSGSDWLMCQPPTAAEFKPKPYPPAPRSSRSWVVVAPPPAERTVSERPLALPPRTLRRSVPFPGEAPGAALRSLLSSEPRAARRPAHPTLGYLRLRPLRPLGGARWGEALVWI